MVDANVAAVVGHRNSGTTIAAFSMYNRAGIPSMSPTASNPALTHQGGRLLFRPYGTDDIVASIASNYAIKSVARQGHFCT